MKKSKTHLGVNLTHDSSVCQITNGEIDWFAEEERFSRIKHESDFPHRSINWCLKNAGLKISEVDHIAINSNPISSSSITKGLADQRNFVFLTSPISKERISSRLIIAFTFEVSSTLTTPKRAPNEY